MDLALTSAALNSGLRQLLRRHGVRPKKGLGQHFLVDAAVAGAIVDAANIQPDDTVLEIGPGPGVLTVDLARRAGRLVAVEIDVRLRSVLDEVLVDLANATVVAADILEVVPHSVAGLEDAPPGRRHGYKVVANLPYYITSAVLRRILEDPVRPELAVVMVQQEVAERITATPGDMSVLAVAVQLYAEPRIVTRVPAEAFVPVPKVDSAVLRLDMRESEDVPVDKIPDFFNVVRAGFGQRRKQLKNSLAAGLAMGSGDVLAALAEAGIDPTRRAETLCIPEWERLHLALAARWSDEDA